MESSTINSEERINSKLSNDLHFQFTKTHIISPKLIYPHKTYMTLYGRLYPIYEGWKPVEYELLKVNSVQYT